MNNPVVVIGSGISGLNFALNVAEHRDVLILTKKESYESSTNYAQGGIAAVLDKLDDFESHIEDTLKAGAFHNNPEAVEFMVRKGPEVIARLIDFGVNFQTFDGRIALTREGGHSHERIAFKGDYTGKEIEEALIQNVRSHPRIEIVEYAFAADIVVRDNIVRGLYFILNGELKFISTSALVLATGGLGQLYKFTTNPLISTGDGIAMAHLAGCETRDMEFVQFHPTVFRPGDSPPFLLSEALRGEGAKLINKEGERFIDELATRDEVATAVYNEGGKVYLDISHKPSSFVKSRFPRIYKYLLDFDLDLTSDRIPVGPAAHYLCGGIEIDFRGRTSVEGLYAFGETAFTGVHGANRLASNSLLEALVFSNELAKELAEGKQNSEDENFESYDPGINFGLDFEARISELQNLMWKDVGVIRNADGLNKAQRQISKMNEELTKNSKNPSGNIVNALRYRNLLICSKLVTRAASGRKETLGCHILA